MPAPSLSVNQNLLFIWQLVFSHSLINSSPTSLQFNLLLHPSIHQPSTISSSCQTKSRSYVRLLFTSAAECHRPFAFSPLCAFSLLQRSCFPASGRAAGVSQRLGASFLLSESRRRGASVLLAQRWSERQRGDRSGSRMRARVLFSLFKIRQRGQLGSEPNFFFFLPFSSSYSLKLVWELNPAEQPVLVGRLLCRRRVGLSEGYPSRAL